MNLKSLMGATVVALMFCVSGLAQDSIQIHEMDEIVITASRMQLPLKSLPQKVELINQSLLDAVPSENLGDVLKRNVNLDVIQYPGAMTTIGLRGFPATAHSRNYTLVLIDGLPAGTNNLATIPSDFIERVEIVKGPYAVLYGSDAMGGVVNIITKKSTRETTGKVSLGVGNFGRTSYTGYVSGSISPKLLFSIGFSRQDQNSDYRIGSKNLLSLSETEKNILDKKSYDDIMTNTQYQINQASGKLEYLINDKWSAKVYSTLVLSNDIETPGNYWHSYGMSKKDIDRIATYGEVKYKEHDNELTISPYLSHQNEANYDNNTDSAFVNSKEKIKQYGVKVGNTHKWGDFRWLIGADADNYDVSSEKFSGKHTPANPYRPDHDRLSLSGFTQLAYSWNNLSVNAGLRYNYISYTLEANSMLDNKKKSEHYSNLNPSLGIKYYIIPNLSVHGSVGSAFYVPDAYKTAGSYTIGKKIYVGNKDLKPETTTSFDLGIGYNIKDYLSLDVTYFQNHYKNKIVNDNAKKDTTSYKNAMDGKMNGLEFLLSSNIATLWNASHRLELYGGLTYFFDNEFDDMAKDASGKETKVTRRTLYTRDMTANFGICFDNNRGFETRINGRYIGNRLENDWMAWDNLRPDIESGDYYLKGGYSESDQILQHSSHLVFDFSSYYTFNRKIRIGVSVSNFLDENYTEKDGYNMPGRALMGHFSYKF